MGEPLDLFAIERNSLLLDWLNGLFYSGSQIMLSWHLECREWSPSWKHAVSVRKLAGIWSNSGEIQKSLQGETWDVALKTPYSCENLWIGSLLSTPQSLWTEVIATRKSVFLDKFKREQVATDLNGDFVRLSRTKFRFQGVGTFICGKRFPKSFINLAVVGWAKRETFNSSVKGWQGRQVNFDGIEG